LIIGNTANDHISGGGNIYTGETPLDETITAPTSGTPGTGFTTLIVQGITAFGPFGGPTPISISSINGVSPTVVVGSDAIGSDQFWAKYEIPGNATTYSFTMTSVDVHESIGLLIVDSYWSASGYATDTAVVPEPSTMVLSGIGVAGLLAGMWRRCRMRRMDV
jgi:PEP-CTERM motif-containing protein